MRIYKAYLESGDLLYTHIIVAYNEEKAREECRGNGDLIALKDVTNDNTIDVPELIKSLVKADTENDTIHIVASLLRATGLGKY